MIMTVKCSAYGETHDYIPLGRAVSLFNEILLPKKLYVKHEKIHRSKELKIK